jgi:uncharacterized secreted repeat protein (TIGR03808 family)
MATGEPTSLSAAGYGSQLSRRDIFRLGAATLVASWPRDMVCAAPDATAWLSARLQDAARSGGAVGLRPGVTAVRSLAIPDGVRLIGAPGRSILRLIGPGPLLYAEAARKIDIESVIFDGGGNSFPDSKLGLLNFADVQHLSIHGCTIRRSGGRGVNLLRCGGRVAQNTIEHVCDAGYFSLDGLGVDIDGNHLRECGDNGVQVWTKIAGQYEGSRVRNNLIEDIHNFSGGDGPYGNGVSIWGSGSVTVENNRIYRCAYTAVRNCAGRDVVVAANDCKNFGEKAMYAEFGAKRSTFKDNRIDDAGAGIAVTNAERGTDVGWVTGNRITGLRETHPDNEFGPSMLWLTGILGEQNCEISGNIIVGSPWIGIALGGYRQNVRAEANSLIDNDYGIVFATGEGVGQGVIARNKISGSKKAAIAGMAGLSVLPDDPTGKGAASKFPRLVVSDNDIR